MMRSCLLGLLPLASGLCLSNGIAPADRKLLVNADGRSYPLGVWSANYAASFAANTMTTILIEEVFGFNTTEGYGAGTVDGMYGVTPCTDPTNIVDRGCDDDGSSKFHIHMESWRSGYPLEWQKIQNLYPKSAPVTLGNMGYYGTSSEYVPRPVIQAAKQAEGLALQYYAFYNASWYDPSKYFENIAAINTTKFMMPCSASIMSDAVTAGRHLKFTGDADGVDMDANNTPISLKCHAGYWWLPPSCRANTSKCAPYITGGIGWGIEIMAQRTTIYNMPVALSVAKSWTEYTTYPLTHPGSILYWWTPDPTFLELAPQVLVYPPYNRRERLAGILTTMDSSISIEKLVSRDLSTLAPNVRSFIDLFFMTLEQMDDILLTQKNTGLSWRNVTCEWLRSNEAQWQAWIPDESKCFAGFGLFDSDAYEYVDVRENATNKIVCQACPSGTYSKEFTDNLGDTYTCVPCAAGTSQPSGASLSCKPCKPGEYQDGTQASTCKRCPIGEYQDESGAVGCKVCPSSTITLGPGSVGLADCGCRETEINVNIYAGQFTCQPCGEGLECPDLSTLASLRSGTSELGEIYTPKILSGYFSKTESPLEVYRCGSESVCPGGMPGTCSGGDNRLVGVPCAKCSEGKTWTGSTCEDCAGWRQVLWGIAVASIFGILTMAYYLTTSKVTAKATVLFATTASVGMLVMSMQNMGLIGMMTVAWPDDLNGVFSICQFLLLDIDSYGFSCIAGQSSPVRYILSAAIFPVGVFWLALCWAMSQLLPKKRRWELSKVVSCMGAFLQVGFSTMSATSLAPMMCYLHPNGQRSILKYPDVICGSADHNVMLIFGWLLLSIFVLGFVAVCGFAVWMVPTWSSRRKDRYVAAVRFLVFRFRLDSWWFGVPLLVRGPLLSLPVVLATDYPPVQIMTITGVMAVFLVMLMLAWPWKVPMLNLTDCVVTFCITLLVTTSSLFLPPVEGPMKAFAHGISTAMLSGIGGAMFVMCCMTASALFYRGAMGGKKELRIFNLGRVANSTKLAAKVKDLAIELEKIDRGDLTAKISGLAVFDMNKITGCITLLATEVAPPAEGAVTYKFNPRINSSSFDPSIKRSKQSKRSTRSSDNMETTEQPEGNETVGEKPARTSEHLKSQWI